MIETNFWIRFVLAVLATWRVTHLLANEDGPADLIAKLRSRLGAGFTGKLLDCFQCLSLWVAAPAAFFVSRGPLGLLFTWLALSGASCLLERIGRDPVVIQPISESAQEEVHNVLWSETGGAEERPAAGDNNADRHAVID